MKLTHAIQMHKSVFRIKNDLNSINFSSTETYKRFQTHYRLWLEKTRNVFPDVLAISILFYLVSMYFVMHMLLISNIHGFSKRIEGISIRCNYQKCFFSISRKLNRLLSFMLRSLWLYYNTPNEVCVGDTSIHYVCFKLLDAKFYILRTVKILKVREVLTDFKNYFYIFPC